jgi:hypothetical protein
MELHRRSRHTIVYCLALFSLGMFVAFERVATGQSQNLKARRVYGKAQAESLLRLRASADGTYVILDSNSQTAVWGTNSTFLYWIISFGDTNTCVFKNQLRAKSFEEEQQSSCTNGTPYAVLFIKKSDILN